MKETGSYKKDKRESERERERPPSNHSSPLCCHYPHELSHSADWLVIVGCSVFVTHKHLHIITARQSRGWFTHLRAKLSNSAWIQITFIQTNECLSSCIYRICCMLNYYYNFILDSLPEKILVALYFTVLFHMNSLLWLQ